MNGVMGHGPSAEVGEQTDADGNANDAHQIHGQPSCQPDFDGGEVAPGRALIDIIFGSGRFLRKLVGRIVIYVFVNIILKEACF